MTRFEAYYYNFESTGCDCVDEILELVAEAGRAYHHTKDWGVLEDDTDTTFIEKIQIAADKAARIMKGS